jgi:hypothetical protein
MGFVPGQPPVIMQPGGKYQFPGKMVYEIPMAYGGDISIPDLSRPNWLDKAQKGQQVKYYDDYSKYLKAAKAEADSSAAYKRDKNFYESVNNYTLNSAFPYEEMLRLVDLNEKIYGHRTEGYSPKPKIKPVYKEKPKEYIPTKTVKLEREPLQLIIPQSDRILDDYNNTRQVLRGIQEEDKSNENLYPTRVVLAPDFRHGGWLEQYQGDTESSQVPANFLWIDQDGQFRDVPIPVPPPKTFEEKVDDFLGNPQEKAMNLNRRINNDNLRHSAASMHTTESLGSTLGAAILAQGLGAAHEISSLPKRIQDTKTDDVDYYDNIYHNVIESGEDVFNNAMGSMVGMIPFIPTRAKESLLVYLSNNNMLPDGKSMPEGNEYVPKKKSGGWLDKYQDGSQVAPNLPGYNPQVGPTIKNAELLKQLEMQEAVRNSQSLNLPSGDIQSTLGPIEYAMLPGLVAPVIKAAMVPKAPADPELEAIRKILRKNVTHIKQTRPLTETPPWPNRFLELGDDAWVIGNAERGRTSVENPDILLPGNLPKRTPKQLPGVNGTQYPNRLPKQKDGGWLDNY